MNICKRKLEIKVAKMLGYYSDDEFSLRYFMLPELTLSDIKISEGNAVLFMTEYFNVFDVDDESYHHSRYFPMRYEGDLTVNILRYQFGQGTNPREIIIRNLINSVISGYWIP